MHEKGIMRPMVSIIMLTYNHEKFISDAINGVLIQKTNFPVQLIVANDHSTDATTAIVEKFRRENPEIVLGFDNKKNLGPRFNFIKAYSYASGKYVAMCEGDDFWSDPYKLQKQVDFMESNPEYVVCFHDIKIINEAGEEKDDKRQPNESKRDFEKYSLLEAYIPTPTILYRKVVNVLPAYFKKSDSGDALLLALLTQFGRAKYIKDIKESFVRVHDGGIWSSRPFLARWNSNLKTKYLIFKSLNGALRKKIFDNYGQMFEMASWDANHYQSKEYWYSYNFKYLQFCITAGEFGKAWLVGRRLINKIFRR